MDAIEIASFLVLGSLLLVAVYEDLTLMRVRNRLILVGYVFGLGFTLLQKGPADVVCYLANISFPVVLLVSLFVIRVLGAGDIKLFSMIGGFLNFKELLWCMVIAFVIGAVYGLFALLHKGQILEKVSHAMVHLGGTLWGEIVPYEGREQKENLMHFTIPICLAVILVKGVMT